MDYYSVCSVPLVDVDAFIAQVAGGSAHATAWALIVAVTVLSTIVATRAVVQGPGMSDAERLDLPRSVTIGHERRWAPSIILMMLANVLLANVAIYVVLTEIS